MEVTKPMEYCSKLQLMVLPDYFSSGIICEISGEPCVGYMKAERIGRMSQQRIRFDINAISKCPVNPDRNRLQSYLDWVNNPQTDKWQPPEE